MLSNPRQPWILDYRYWISDSLSVEFGYQIPVASRIPDSLSCIPDSKVQDSGSHKPKVLDPGIQFSLHGAAGRF